MLLAFKSTISSNPMANISIGLSQFAALTTISENQAKAIQCLSFKTITIHKFIQVLCKSHHGFEPHFYIIIIYLLGFEQGFFWHKNQQSSD